MKICTNCSIEKPIASFWRDSRYPAPRRVARCIQCASDIKKAYTTNNRDLLNAKAREKSKLDPWRKRERHLVRKYGITQVEYDQLLISQGSACAICKRQQSKSFDVDHDHSTGHVRGLLCTNCNRMIGHAADSPERLRIAAKYLMSSLSKRRR